MNECLIQNKETLNEYLEYERRLYFPNMNKRSIRRMKRLHWKRYQIWKCMYYLRIAEYYYYCCIRDKNSKRSLKHKVYGMLLDYYTRKKNIACDCAGIELNLNRMGKGADIWHGSVVINGNIGADCCFHGTNTIGIKSNDRNLACPNLGNRVDVGVGAMIVGDVTIADNCVIGAGAVVTKSCFEPGTVLVGVPAAPLKQKEG